MDLYQLRYFLEAARHLSFTRAAKSAHVSVPAISRSVTLLERSLKRKLFVRGGRRVTLKLPSGRKTAVRVVLRVRRQGRSRAQVVHRTFARC